MEILNLDDQLDHPALRLIAARPDLFSRQGHIDASYRRRGPKLFGPYYRLSYRLQGRQYSVYLGRPSLLVDRVRNLLASLQQPRNQRRILNRLRRTIRASLRVEKLHLASLLRPYGLRMKGFEVRGWRFSPLRTPMPGRSRLISQIVKSKTHPVSLQNIPALRLKRFLAARRHLSALAP